jgi:hypothetical protein
MTTKRDPRALFRAMKEQELEDDLDEILAMSDAELDRELAAGGGDPAAIRAAGVAHVARLIGDRERLAWHGAAASKLDALRATAAAMKTKTRLSRDELLTRIAIARENPRFAAPVAVLFQKKTEEAATDEELQDLLDEIELLAKVENE